MKDVVNDRETDCRLFFIIGSGRCGSTPVQEILSRHPDVGFISNVDTLFARFNLKGRWNNEIFAKAPRLLAQRERIRGRSVRQTRVHYGPSEGWRLLRRHISPMFSEPFRDLRAADVTPPLESRMKSFFAERAAAQNKPVFLHHLTGWPRSGFIREVFPDARFIHVVRDGRAVASSYLHWPLWRGWLGPEGWRFGPLPDAYAREWEEGDRSFALLAGLEWKILMDAFAAAEVLVPSHQWIQIRYEDFVTDPIASSKKLLGFMQLPWSEHFKSQLSSYSLSKTRTEGFRSSLTGPQLEMLDLSLGEHLRRFGYLP